MGKIIQSNAAPEFDNRRSEVLSVTDVAIKAVSFTNADGQKSMCLVAIFGTDNEDGGPGVFVISDETEMRNWKIPSKMIKQGVRRAIGAAKETTADGVPEHLEGAVVDALKVEVSE